MRMNESIIVAVLAAAVVAVPAVVSAQTTATPDATLADQDAVRMFAADEMPDADEVARLLEGDDDRPATRTRAVRLLGAAADGEAKRVAPVRKTQRKSVAVPVRFSFGSAEMTPEDAARIDAVATAIKRLPLERVVVIEGHTDAHGSAQYNLDLSLKRANAVRDYLIAQHGIAAGKLVARGFGHSVPIVRSNPYAAENRRVQFKTA